MRTIWWLEHLIWFHPWTGHVRPFAAPFWIESLLITFPRNLTQFWKHLLNRRILLNLKRNFSHFEREWTRGWWLYQSRQPIEFPSIKCRQLRMLREVRSILSANSAALQIDSRRLTTNWLVSRAPFRSVLFVKAEEPAEKKTNVNPNQFQIFLRWNFNKLFGKLNWKGPLELAFHNKHHGKSSEWSQFHKIKWK